MIDEDRAAANRAARRARKQAHLRALYDRHVAERHIDIGVGTGYFLDRARFPVPDPGIVLVDPNRACLDRAARRLARYRPETVEASAFDPLPVEGPFESAGLCYLLHCLPGTMAGKAAVFDRLAPLLAPGATVFGATILQGDAPRSRAARRLMAAYNARGTFSNAADTCEALKAELDARFAEVEIELIGCVALFAAR
jgi:trans-aconitate methyltransferase